MLKTTFLNKNFYSSKVTNTAKSARPGEFFFRELLLRGVGFKFALLENKLYLRLGYSHYLSINIPETIKARSRKDKLVLFGSNLSDVSNFASLVRSLRYPDSYKFKGVSYSSEPVVVKVGKQR